MVSGDLLLEARRRAGLTQAQLGERLEQPQQAVARWEKGEVAPSLETLRSLVEACGLELSFKLANADNSYRPDIEELLELEPTERLSLMLASANHTCRTVWFAKRGRGEPVECWHEFNPLPIFEALEAASVDYVLIGSLAGTLQGAPLIPADFTVAITPKESRANTKKLKDVLDNLDARLSQDSDSYSRSDPVELWLIEALGATVAIKFSPRGTDGYGDLCRDSRSVEARSGLSVLTASLIDLVRIAGACIRPSERLDRVALRTTLELSRLRAGSRGA